MSRQPTRSGMVQDQFLEVIDRDEAERRFHAVLDLQPLPEELVPLSAALGRVLAHDVTAPVDVPSFDRSNVDGFAVRAEDTHGADELNPVDLRLNPDELLPGAMPRHHVSRGTATPIATGAMVPRGANAVVMIEHTDLKENTLRVVRPAAPGGNITSAGTDIGRGETVLRRGEIITSRETGVLAALGLAQVAVRRQPRIAIISTGDELIAAGEPMRPGLVYDSNAAILAGAVRELGGEPILFGIIPDDETMLRARLREALDCDVVLLSGGTSKGAGDVSYRVVDGLGEPGIVVHGVALKPGKPICLAAVDGKPVVILPGFPTSAIFTFHEFVAPVIRRLAGRAGGRSEDAAAAVPARLPMRINSERGRTEYLLVNLIPSSESAFPSSGSPALIAYPMGKGSGSVTAFSRADGFITIPRQREYLEEGELVRVQLLGQELKPADLVVIGSHCVGLDCLLGELQTRGYRSKFLAVGSTAGLAAARRGECDLAGIHLLDPATGIYNRPFVGDDLLLVPGYRRLQGMVFRRGDSRFEARSLEEALAAAMNDPRCLMINRNRGSGTRILIDELLNRHSRRTGNAPVPHRLEGYHVEARSHNAVAAAVAQGRADWGLCIETVARDAELGFVPLTDERFDFVIPKSRRNRPAVLAFQQLLGEPAVRAVLQRFGFRTDAA